MASLFFIFALLFLSFPLAVPPLHSYPTGPPPSACTYDLPQHAGIPQITPPPFFIVPQNLTQNTFIIGFPVTFILFSTISTRPFKGFMVSAQDENQNKIGQWVTSPGDPTPFTNQMCGDQVAIGHANRANKSEISLVWTPPLVDFPIGVVTINVTIVESYGIFWKLSPLRFSQKVIPIAPSPPILSLSLVSTLSNSSSLLSFQYNSYFSGSSPLSFYSVYYIVGSNYHILYEGLNENITITSVGVDIIRPFSSYSFVVRSVNEDNMGAESNVLMVSTPPYKWSAMPIGSQIIPSSTQPLTTAVNIFSTPPVLNGIQLIGYQFNIYTNGQNQNHSDQRAIITYPLTESFNTTLTGLQVGTNYDVHLSTITAGINGNNYITAPSISSFRTMDCNNGAGCGPNGTCYGIVNSPTSSPQCHCDWGFIGSSCSLSSPQGPQCIPPNDDVCLDFVIDGRPPAIDWINVTISLRTRIRTAGWIGFLFTTESDGMSGGKGWRSLVDSLNNSVITMMYADGTKMPMDQPLHIPSSVGYHTVDSSGVAVTDITYSWRLGGNINDDPSAPHRLLLDQYAASGNICPVSFAFGDTEEFSKHQNGHMGRFFIDIQNEYIIVQTIPSLYIIYLYPLTAFLIFVFLGGLIVTSPRLRYHRFLHFTTPIDPVDTSSASPLMRIIHFFLLDFPQHVSIIVPNEILFIILYFIVLIMFVTVGYNQYSNAEGRSWHPVWGHLVVFHLPITFLIPTKQSIWTYIFLAPFDRLIKYHRWIARMTLIALLVHMLTMINHHGLQVITKKEDTPYGHGVLYGFFTFLTISIVVVTSNSYIRKNAYEVFYYVHMVGILLAVVFAFLHCRLIVYSLTVPLLLYVFDKGSRMAGAYGRRFVIQNMECFFDDDQGVHVAKITINAVRDNGEKEKEEGKGGEGPSALLSESDFVNESTPSSSPLITHPPLSYSPGQYFLLSFPTIDPISFHPLSVSSSPTSTVTNHQITFHILDVGREEWTHKVAEMAQEFQDKRRINKGNHQNNEKYMRLLSPSPHDISSFPHVRIHGPYGNFTLNPFLHSSIVVCGGGIGVTPFFSLLEEIVIRYEQQDPSIHRLQSVYFLFTARTLQAFSLWNPKLLTTMMQHTEIFHMFLYANLPIPSANDSNDFGNQMPTSHSENNISICNSLRVHRERMNLPLIFHKIDKLQLSSGLVSEIHPCGVFTCGPDRFTTEILSLARRRQWNVHNEIFRW